VAAGFFTYALGSQTVGSVIRPAAYCGIAGFKPSLGRIETRGMVPFSETADHVGVFAGSAAALAPVLPVLVDTWREAARPKRLRLGVPVGAFLEQAEPLALAAFDRQLARLASAGCELVRVSILDDIEAVNARHTDLIAGEMARFHAAWFEAQSHRYRGVTREMIVKGLAVEEAELPRLRESCRDLRGDLAAAMRDHGLDAWVCPAATGEAPRGLATTGSPLMNLPWTHAGLPAVTIPAGRGPHGLPLGLQIVGDFGADEALLGLAAGIEPCFSNRQNTGIVLSAAGRRPA
jgi:Asp-tRNA(Asn)/Glu-tRNA(Gln) amidotransferase A subunit family amidase